jgi:hypothetical protein
MKKILSSFTLILFLISCKPTTQITGTWKNPKQPVKNYSNIFIASLSSNSVARSTVETDMAAAFEKENISTYKGVDEFTLGIQKDSLTREEILSVVRNKKSDAILTITLIRKETDSRYVKGDRAYAPFPHFAYYGDFTGYYSFWYPSVNMQGYYVRDKSYYLETNLYDGASEQLIWSAQSKTYNPVSLQSFSKEFSKLIVAKLKSDGMLKPMSDLSGRK